MSFDKLKLEEKKYTGKFYTALTYRMDKKIKRKWVNALRGGSFTQGTQALKTVASDKVGHCCLGVLCEVQGLRETYGTNITLTPSKVLFIFEESSRSETFLPMGLPQKVGIRYNSLANAGGPFNSNQIVNPALFNILVHHANGPMSLEANMNVTLAELNDSNFTFDQIADLIDYFL